MNEWKECPKCKCLNKGRERCQDCGRDLKDVAGDKPTPPITAGTKHVGISDLLDALRQYWNERIERKRASARNFAAGGEYSIAARLAAEVEATELCLKDLETESALTLRISHAGLMTHK